MCAKLYGPSITKHPDNGCIRIAFTIHDTSLVLRMNEQTGEWDLTGQQTYSPASIVDKHTLLEGKLDKGLIYVRPN